MLLAILFLLQSGVTFKQVCCGLTEYDEDLGRLAGVRLRECDVTEHVGGVPNAQKLSPVLVDVLPPLTLFDHAVLV